jgi:regulation of enolase protein 1 (concanavalin A-like superfamily)
VTTMKIAGVPFELETAWPENWQLTGESVAGRAGALTDLFTDPFGSRKVSNAPALLFPVSGDFLLEAAVQVEFTFTFDAGVLLLWQDEDHWAKLCFEFSPKGQAMVVSVVTRDVSDDCNSVSIGGDRVHLRIGRRGLGCVFHYSEDGKYWHMVRAFRLADKPMKAGFLVQSPKGEGSRAEFRAIRYREETLADIRSGV